MPTVLDVTNPTARKPHTCDLCGAPIAPGEKYERQRCVYDGHMYAWLTCVPCQEVAHQAWEYYADTIDYDEGLGTETCDEWAHDHLDSSVAIAYLARRDAAYMASLKRKPKQVTR